VNNGAALWIVTRGKSYGDRSVAQQTMPEPRLINPVDERWVDETPIPFQRGYDCNLESGDIGHSKVRNKQILTALNVNWLLE